MKHPPYHLRANKAIDRLSLVRLMDAADRAFGLDKHTYIGFGGPFLEDIRYVHQQFVSMKCISLESNKQTFLRQKFHKTTRNVDLVNKTLETYLNHHFEPDGPVIFWLDYTKLKPTCLSEFVQVLSNVHDQSIVKITLNAEGIKPTQHTGTGSESYHEIDEEIDKKFKTFSADFDEWLPVANDIKMIKQADFEIVLEGMVRVAAEVALSGTGRIFHPLASCVYADGVKMLSVTGLVVKQAEEKTVEKKFRSCRQYGGTWGAPEIIDVPNLSVKERLALERLLPIKQGDGRCLKNTLGYRIDDSEKKSMKMLQQYMRYYDCYPIFSKIGV